MKKIFKSCLLMLVAVCVSFSFVGCKKKVSPTTTNTDNIKFSNGVTTNGGMTVVHGDYLYFINGTKENNGTSQNKNTRSAICRVKYDMSTGETSGDMEVVVDELVGFINGSLYIFGDFLYYATPSNGENSKGEILYNKTEFKRYDLVNEKSHTMYTTALNSSSETVDYAYYVVDETLNLLVYEKSSATIRSLKIDKKVTENYVIESVVSCLFSENYGTVTTTGATSDANSYVFYTLAPGAFDAEQTGSKVYKTSPVTDNSKLISSGKDIALLTIRCGKLLYTYNSFVYANVVNDSTETLSTENADCISRATLDNAIYLENYSLVNKEGDDSKKQLVKSEGSITVLTLTKSTDSAYYFNIFEWTNEGNSSNDNYETIAIMSSSKEFSFIGITTMTEVITEADEDKGIEEETKDVLYAVFMDSSIVYKIKIADYTSDSDVLDVSGYSEKIKMSTTTVSATTGLLAPEIVGDYLFIMAADSDKNSYLYKVDLTLTENATKASDKFALEE